ncbi:MAG: transcriptional regulator [Sphingobacteriales bacterium]|nr:MAG: transcriptional regulator [Sphingobacteriales bacterium]
MDSLQTSQKNVTTNSTIANNNNCPGEDVLKLLSGKWKPQIFKLAYSGPIRFNTILRELPDANKQSIATALRELEEGEMLNKTIVSQKPLHIEYELSDKGRQMIQVYKLVAQISAH